MCLHNIFQNDIVCLMQWFVFNVMLMCMYVYTWLCVCGHTPNSAYMVNRDQCSGIGSLCPPCDLVTELLPSNLLQTQSCRKTAETLSYHLFSDLEISLIKICAMCFCFGACVCAHALVHISLVKILFGGETLYVSESVSPLSGLLGKMLFLVTL